MNMLSQSLTQRRERGGERAERASIYPSWFREDDDAWGAAPVCCVVVGRVWFEVEVNQTLCVVLHR